MSAATIEDYKKYVRELKTRIKLLTEGNTQLKIDLERAKLSPKVPGKSSDPLTWMVRANKAIMLIQNNQQGMLGQVLVFASGLHQASYFLLPFNYHSYTYIMNLSISILGMTPTWLQ